jgi:ATP-dependent DNA ligase
MPHIVAEIERIFRDDIVLDGELYNHEFKDNFEHIIHLVRQEVPDPSHTDVQYHVYDIVNADPFSERAERIRKIFTIGPPRFRYLVKAETFRVDGEDEVTDYFQQFRDEGYEGAILRNAAGLYAHKRSADLIKLKEMEDAEFKITGIEEGRGKLQGHVAAFVCEMPDGQTFKAKMRGDTDMLRKYFENHSLWQGKLLTVKFQNLTGKNGVPRFPVGLRFRGEL